MRVESRPSSRLPRVGARILDIGSSGEETLDERARRMLLVGISLMVLPAGVLWGTLYWLFDERVAALFPWGYTVASAGALALFARTRDVALLRSIELALILVTPALLVLALGGLEPSSGVILWSLLAPLGALVFDPSRAWLWFGAFLGLLVVSIPLAPVVRPDAAAMPDGAVQAFAALNIAGVALVAFVLLATFARQRAEALERVQSLLLNILPGEIAHRLQAAEPQTIADHFDEASILFADVVDFTPLSSRLDAREIVGLLDRLFTAFDELADRYGVEKIKTIGDCYMVAAGVPAQRSDHAHALVRVALDMRECAKACLPANGRDLQLRIGIATGPVVAGVIGRRRFLYDLWGDTVNMASRMESQGVPGSIQMTRTTWELVRDEFETVPRGFVEVKGKGEVEAWHLLGPRVG